LPSAGHLTAGDEMFLAAVVVVIRTVDVGQGAHVEVSVVSVEVTFVVVVVGVSGG